MYSFIPSYEAIETCNYPESHTTTKRTGKICEETVSELPFNEKKTAPSINVIKLTCDMSLNVPLMW